MAFSVEATTVRITFSSVCAAACSVVFWQVGRPSGRTLSTRLRAATFSATPSTTTGTTFIAVPDIPIAPHICCRNSLMSSISVIIPLPPLRADLTHPPQQPCRRTDAPAALRVPQTVDRASPCRSSHPLHVTPAAVSSLPRHSSSRDFPSAHQPAGSTANPPAPAPPPPFAADHRRAALDSAASGAPYSHARATPALSFCALSRAFPHDRSTAAPHFRPQSGRRSD